MLIETPLGQMLAYGDEEAVHRLEFTTEAIRNDLTPPLLLLAEELRLYFLGELTEFKTPIAFHGTPFQISVWKELLKIPFGETASYADIAKRVGKPTAYRAVANANGSNLLTLLVPCHRVIYTGGGLGGYGAGPKRKKWLLEFERRKK